MTELHNTLSPGARDDIQGGRALSALHPFFGAKGAAQTFVARALAPYLPDLADEQTPVRCVDVGGGEGAVAAALGAFMREAGISNDILVLDQNSQYLNTAAAGGLKTRNGTVVDLPEGRADCAILRFVNHYNTRSGQTALAADLARLVRANGVLAAQIETGDAQTCGLLENIAGLLSGDGADAGRHWPTLEMFLNTYAAAGFDLVEVLGRDVIDSQPVEESLAAAWDRVHGPALQSYLMENDVDGAVKTLNDRDDFFIKARAALASESTPGVLHTAQPIVILRRRPTGADHAIIRTGSS